MVTSRPQSGSRAMNACCPLAFSTYYTIRDTNQGMATYSQRLFTPNQNKPHRHAQ